MARTPPRFTTYFALGKISISSSRRRASGSVSRPCPAEQGLDVGIGKADVGVGGNQQRGRRAHRRPVFAALIQAVVHPGQRSIAGVDLDWPDLPMCGAESGAAVEAEDRELAPVGRGCRAGGRWPDPPTRSPRRSRNRRRAPAGGRRPRPVCSGPSRRSGGTGRGPRSRGPSNPNRLITPSTSRASIGRSGRCDALSLARAIAKIPRPVPTTSQLIEGAASARRRRWRPPA